MSIDWTKPIYVNQVACSEEPEDLFVVGKPYTARGETFLDTRLLIGPRQEHTGDRWVMWAKESNCSNTPWPTPAAASPPTPKPIEDRLADLAIELRAYPDYASNALGQQAFNHIRQAIAILDRIAADKRREGQGL